MFGKTNKNNGKPGEKIEALKLVRPTDQKLAIEDAIPEDQLNKETKNNIEIKKWKKW